MGLKFSLMERGTKASGGRISLTGKERSGRQMEIDLKENGGMDRPTDMECTLLKMEHNIRGSGGTICRMEGELSIGLMARYIKSNTRRDTSFPAP